jgi:hypothetical protein
MHFTFITEVLESVCSVNINFLRGKFNHKNCSAHGNYLTPLINYYFGWWFIAEKYETKITDVVQKSSVICDMWDIYGTKHKRHCLVWCDTLWSGVTVPIFKRDIMIPSCALKIEEAGCFETSVPVYQTKRLHTFFHWLYRPLGPWPLIFRFHDHSTDGRTPWTSDELVARPLPKHRTTQTQNKHIHIPNMHDLCGIRNHYPGFRANEDSTCLRPLGYREGQTASCTRRKQQVKLCSWVL